MFTSTIKPSTIQEAKKNPFVILRQPQTLVDEQFQLQRWREHVLLPLQVEILSLFVHTDPVQFGAYYFPRKRLLEKLVKEREQYETDQRVRKIEALIQSCEEKNGRYHSI